MAVQAELQTVYVVDNFPCMRAAEHSERATIPNGSILCGCRMVSCCLYRENSVLAH